MRINPILTILFLSFWLSDSALGGKLYKWTDEDGRVHYADRLPAVDAKRAHSALDENGVTIDRVDAAKTPEEIKQAQELERLRQERERLIEKQRAEDRVLLRTFRSEDDIILTRDGQLQAVDASINITRANIKRLKSSLEDLQRLAAARELAGKQISPKLKLEINDKNQALKDAYQSIIDRERDKDRIRIAFAKDQQRFRELKQLEQSNDPLQEATESFVEALMNVYDCGDNSRCEQAWQRARAYMRQYNTTPITMDADNILMSGTPMEENDISITLSRMQDTKGGNTLIFLDLQCKDSPQGSKFCNSEKVQNIKQGFQPALGVAIRANPPPAPDQDISSGPQQDESIPEQAGL
jgi:hypothetical protein